MSTVTGNIKELGLRIAQTTVRFHPLDNAIIAGGALIFSGKDIAVRSDALGNFSAVVVNGNFEVWVGEKNRFEINVPNDFLEYDIVDLLAEDFTPPAQPEIPTSSDLDLKLIEWALADAFRKTAPIRDSDGVITSSPVIWPNLATGTYTLLEKSTIQPEPDSWQVTYDPTGQTVTQPTITRDADANEIDHPFPVLS